MYKIRNRNNPLEYVSGTPARWNYGNNGRIFAKIGRLRAFLTGVISDKTSSQHISDWEIVEYECVVASVKPVNEVITPATLIKLLTK